MLLKYGSQAQKRIKASGIGKPQRTPGGMVKLTSGLVAVVPKNHRRVIKVASKRPAALHRTPTAVKRERILVDPCDNSNDSGLGFDHHLDYHNTLASHSALRFSDKEAAWQAEESPEVKRRRLEIKLESDDANDNFTFPETVRQPAPRTICAPARVRSRVVNLPVTLTSQLSATSQSGLTQLQIACQPEQQHRARYQTEGSRGAVKDRTGNGFPVVKLVGYDRPATLQVFIGTDQGRVAPHMFYQACRVSGKNSTPCVEKKVDGTIVIEVEIEPSKDMVVTCDCVGILKERNVDVEHRFPEEGSGRSKKKSTRCRMVFRTVIINQDGVQETLQVTSQPIVCTQPPGVPEICKKSLTSCSVRGGQELFILGKNFLKDTRVLFQEGDGCTTWTQSVQPDKEFLQQSHLVCVVPPYLKADISEPVSVRLVVESSGKASEPHNFLYLPDTSVLVPDGNMVNSSVITQGGNTARVFPASLPMPTIIPSEPAAAPFITAKTSPRIEEKINPAMMWDKPAEVMMPPPSPAILPITVRRSSVQMIVPDTLTSEALKQEVPETVLDPPKPMASVADLSSTQSPSMDTFHRFVSNNKSLPAINVSTYLSNIEGNSVYTDKVIKAPMMNELPQIIIPSNKPMLAGDSSNLLTTVESILVNPTAVLPFEGRHLSGSPCASHSTQEGLSVIVTSPTIQNNTLESNMSQEGQRHPQITEIQHSGLDILMAKHILMNKQERSATEGLDAFVNSAAESHISPNPTSPTTASVISDRSVINHIPEIVVNGTNDRSKVQDADILPMVQAASLQVSPRTSPPHGTTNDTLCSLLTSTTQVQPIQTNLEQMKNQIVSSSHSNINSLIQSQVSTNQVFSNVHASLEQQLSSQSVSSTRLSHDDGLHNLMQSPPSSHQVQPLSTIQASFQQQLTSQLDSSQLNHTDLNNILDSSPSQTNQGQGVPNLHASLEQQLSTQPMSSSQVNQCNLSNLMQSSPQNSQNDGRALSSLQRTFEQTLSPQSETSSQTLSESLQSSNVCSRSQIQVLNNFQTSLEHHLTSQVINSNQANIECLTSASIRLTGMESSLPTSSQIQAAVNQAQVISNLHTSLEHHLSSQPVTESVTPNVHSPISQNSSLEASQPPVSQTQALSDLQMSLGHLTSQVMTSASPSHDSRTGNLSQTAAAQVIANQAQTLSSLQASLEQQILTSSEPMMPSERLSNSINISAQQTSTLTNIQASIDHLSSQVLSSSQSNHSESLPSNLTISDPQSCPMSLVGSQPLTYVSNNSSASSTMILSPISHRSPTSVLISPQISLSSSPTLALSPTNLSLQNSRPIEINSPNLVLNTPHNLLASNVSLSNPQSATLNSVDLQLQSSQSTILRPNAISPFEQVTTSISHGIPVQVTAMNQFGQHQEMQSVSKDCERKEPLQFLIPPEQVAVPPQVPVPTVKKCEEGMPVPHELTQMSEHDLIRYINPSCFDTV